MQNCPIPIAELENIYAGLHRIGVMGDGISSGYSRPAYSDIESKAVRYIERLARESGLHVRYDGVGNLIVELPGSYPGWIETGSHLDTVPGGGNFDGAAGVVAGLAVLRLANRSGKTLKRGLRLRVWRGEESASFGLASIGSRAAFGLLPADALNASDGKQTLAEAMRSQRARPELIRRQKAAIDAAERDAIAAHIELHIEQGNVLEKSGCDVGVVSGIRGSMRSWVMLEGQFDHSGATPMGIEYRRDVNLAMAHMQVRLDQLAAHVIAAGEDLVQTVGVINSSETMSRRMPEVSANAVSRVSGSGYFSHEIRSCSPATMERFGKQAFALIQDTARQFAITAQIETFSRLNGIPALDQSLQKQLGMAIDAASLTQMKLASGAWHDAAALCGVNRSDGSPIPVGMLFVPCRAGISHSAEEFTSYAQLASGATVLATAMLDLAG